MKSTKKLRGRFAKSVEGKVSIVKRCEVYELRHESKVVCSSNSKATVLEFGILVGLLPDYNNERTSIK